MTTRPNPIVEALEMVKYDGPRTLEWYRALEESVKLVLPLARQQAEELERVGRERDLALAHDQQPYPTAHAYEKVCENNERLKVLVQEMRAHLLTIFTTEADWKASRKVLLRRVRKELANAPERF